MLEIQPEVEVLKAENTIRFKIEPDVEALDTENKISNKLYNTENCPICELYLDSDIQTVKRLAIKKITKASQEREDGKEKLFQGLEELCLHKKCWKMYIEEKCIRAYKRRKMREASGINSNENILLKKPKRQGTLANHTNMICIENYKKPVALDTSNIRTKVPSILPFENPKPLEISTFHSNKAFDSKIHCLFCNNDATEEYMKSQNRLPREKRNVVVKITRPQTQNTIIRAATTYDDYWSQEVLLRINGINLCESNAVYHSKCYAKFCNTRKTGRKIGRIMSPKNAYVMNVISNLLEKNKDCQISFDDIREILSDLEVPSDQTINYFLKRKYGDGIIITSEKPHVVCLMSESVPVVKNVWCEVRDEEDTNNGNKEIEDVAAEISSGDLQSDVRETENPFTVKQNTVDAAAKIILEDLKSDIGITENPPPSDLQLLPAVEEYLDSLMRFLRRIITHNKVNGEFYESKCIAIARDIVSAARQPMIKEEDPLVI